MAADDARVVVTGLGLIHALGQGVDPLLEELAAGDEPLEPGDVAECFDFDPEQLRESSKTYMDRCADLLLGACYLAVRDAHEDWSGPEDSRIAGDRSGVSIGTAFGPTESMLNMTGRVQSKGLRFGSPMIFTHTFVNAPAALVSIEYGLQGPCMTHVMGDSSGGVALVYAAAMLRRGRADVIIAGGVDAASRPLLAALDASGDDRPVGEAAAVLMLETADAARARGARILAELVADTAPSEAREVSAPAACGHSFGASVALSAACCAGLIARGEAGPLVAASPDDSTAIMFREWAD